MSKEYVQALADLEEETAIERTNERLSSGENPLAILGDVKEGMSIVGDRFAEEEYFLPDLMYAGEIIEQVSELLTDEMPDESESDSIGTAIIGTVEDDIHDIGKDLVIFMFDLNGFDVVDMGVDVPPQEFVNAVDEHEPDILGLSGFLTSAFDSMKETVDALEEADLRNDVRIMIGGGQITEEVTEYVGADGFETDAPGGVELAKDWLDA